MIANIRKSNKWGIKMTNKYDKVNKDFVIQSFSYENTLRQYSGDTFNIGLWELEKYLITKYFNKEDRILDIGCGAGRTTIGMYRLGYKNIFGIDLTPVMIEEARKNTAREGAEIEFQVDDACNLSLKDQSFDCALFSFNGIMQIPRNENRLRAFKEICRVLKKGGVFIFTTHDRNDKEWKWFWDEEAERWAKGKQDKRLHEFGDRVIEDNSRLIYLHFPDRKEILDYIEESGFELIEEACLFELLDESEQVKNRASRCKFWVVRKK